MSHNAKTVWIPGMSVLFLSTIVLLIMTRLIPPHTWLYPRTLLSIGSLWALSYLVSGALAAYWSRRAGGSRTARFLAGTFPLSLHGVVFILPVFVALISRVPTFPEHLRLSFLVQAGILWLALPGFVLALGTLPFLRERSGN